MRFAASLLRLFGSVSGFLCGAGQFTSPLVGLGHRSGPLLGETLRTLTLPHREDKRTLGTLPLGVCCACSLFRFAPGCSLDLDPVLSRLGTGNRCSMCCLGLSRGRPELQ